MGQISKTGRQEKPQALSARSPSSSAQTAWIAVQLSGLAIARQAKLAKEDLDVYSTALAAYPQEDLLGALQQLALHRQEYETAFPPLWRIVEELEAMARKKQEEAAKRERLKLCGKCTGYLMLFENPQGERYARDCDCVLERNKREKMAAAQQQIFAGEAR